MAMKVVILEDNPDRVRVMRDCLEDRFSRFECRFFDDPAETMEYLEANLAETVLIGLDHDLELKEAPSGKMIDPGTGREVADYLAGKPAVCPVVIHTTNAPAAAGMEMVLKDARWKTYRVVPFDDLEWIPTDWLRTVRRAIVRPQ
jgi:CheY-like chemotaxis protein